MEETNEGVVCIHWEEVRGYGIQSIISECNIENPSWIPLLIFNSIVRGSWEINSWINGECANSKICIVEYGINLLVPEVHFPHGNLISIIPILVWNNQTSIVNMLSITSYGNTRNHN